MEPRNPTSAFFFSKTNLLYLEPTFGMNGAKQTDTHDRFSCYVLMWTENKCFLEKVSAENKVIILSFSMNMNNVCWSPILFIYFLVLLKVLFLFLLPKNNLLLYL